MKLFRPIAAFVALAAGLACGGDGPTEPEVEVGSLSFTYSGAVSGTFAVTGAVNMDEGPLASDGAGALVDDEVDMIAVVAARARSSTHVDVIQLAIPRVTGPRTFLLDEESCASPLTACPFAILGIDIPVPPPTGGAPPPIPEGLYLFTSGRVVITSVSATRIAGTFQGSAESLETNLSMPPRVVTVANGTFDVPILKPPAASRE